MSFNNRKLNSVRLYGKEVNLSQIGPSWQIHTAIRPIRCIVNGEQLRKPPKLPHFP